MFKKKQIYEGKAKILFEGPEPGTIIQHFKDDVTAFNNQKRGLVSGKGVINNRISELVMLKLGEIGIPNHFIRTLNMREQLVKKVDIIPVEVIVRNVVAGSMAKRLGFEEGVVLPRNIIEFCFKNDNLNDPLISEEHIITFGWANPIELEEIKAFATRINDFLIGMFFGVGIRLIDFKIEFGRININDMEHIVLADEISPDSCRLWDIKTNERMDKDRFRRDLGNIEEAYREVARRLGVLVNIDPNEEE
ncbi:Phosphoribosylaminoimidazole-succinocarboxamide synthase [Rickettsiales bacterium Ac37b]|nr:Phosphoribosylaminoimidazole-succinocarboxamide synthase [Rickettsiales bacterium Ac37b]